MVQDREQGRPEEREGAARPVTAAARRERRASARDSAAAGRDGRVEDRAPAKAPGSSRSRRARPTDDEAKKTQSKKDQGVATPKREGRDKRVSLVTRFIRFVREVIAELRKVIWPTRKQQITYTTVVLVFVAFIVALVYGLDLVFAKGVFLVFA